MGCAKTKTKTKTETERQRQRDKDRNMMLQVRSYAAGLLRRCGGYDTPSRALAGRHLAAAFPWPSWASVQETPHGETATGTAGAASHHGSTQTRLSQLILLRMAEAASAPHDAGVFRGC